MIRHRSGIALEKSDDESSSDDDVFCASSRKRRMKRRSFDNLGIAPTSSRTVPRTSNVVNDTEPLSPGKEVIHRETSSNKRHHHQSSQRAANMDAWLQELEETPLASKNDVKQKAPDKLGSYCLPGEEDSTTNIFVGANLSPLTTEEQLADLFRQFGKCVMLCKSDRTGTHSLLIILRILVKWFRRIVQRENYVAKNS